MDSNELRHYGVKGQKWGIRRLSKQGTSTAKTSGTDDNNREHGQGTQKSSHKPKDVKTMTDAELNRAINRLRMETEYARLTQKEISAGQKFVNDVLKKSSKAVATKYATKAMSAGVDKAIAAVAKKK